MKRLTRALFIIAALIFVIGVYNSEPKDNKVDQAEQRPEAYDQSIKKNQGRSDGLPSPQETIWRMDAEKHRKQEITNQVRKISKWGLGEWTEFGNGERRIYRGQFTFVDMEYTARTDRYTCVYDAEYGNDFFIGYG